MDCVAWIPSSRAQQRRAADFKHERRDHGHRPNETLHRACQFVALSQTLATEFAKAAMRVLVTGADGYIGFVLTPYLKERGYDVVGLDTGYYRAGWLFHDSQSRPSVMTKDIRDVRP